MGIIVEDDSIVTEITINLGNISTNPVVMTNIHKIFEAYMNPYVPMNTGQLATTTSVSENGVRYNSEYAHYMYNGIVYSPNIPIIKDGVIVGWYSPPQKFPTSRKINYNTQIHSLATHHWDDAMMNSQGENFISDVTKILLKHFSGLGG